MNEYSLAKVKLLISLFLIFRSEKVELLKNVVYRFGIIIVSIFIGFHTIKKCNAEIKWNSLMNKDNLSLEEIRLYKPLYQVLKKDSRFLYNYAVRMYDIGCLEKSLSLAMECNTLLSDYNLSLLFGDIYFELHDDNKAIEYYTLAHNMVPNRFAPLCAIYDIYKRAGDKERCRLLAKEILDKPIKVRSKETMQYINYIKKEVESQNK